MEMIAERVRLVRDADGASCRECSEVFGRYWQPSNVPWDDCDWSFEDEHWMYELVPIEETVPA